MDVNELCFNRFAVNKISSLQISASPDNPRFIQEFRRKKTKYIITWSISVLKTFSSLKSVLISKRREIKNLALFRYKPELQIRGGILDNSKTIFLISRRKHTL